ncbi:MAG: alanine racemase [Gemmatimonadota bacterium]|nr:alanine racemase [Gemmatimonadota bacterium]
MHNTMIRAWVEVDLGALQRNGATLAARAGVPLLPMVKADAYGIGARAAARALESLEPWGYGVATISEGVALRDAGIRRPIVVFTPLLSPDLPGARDATLRPVLSRPEEIANWASIRGGPWHLGIDTGMSRAGVRWDAVEALGEAVGTCPPEGACTHLHSSELGDSSADEQEERFLDAIAALPVRPTLLHVENSAAITRRGRSRWDLVRPGVFLYGVGSGAGAEALPEPVVSVRARIVDTRWVNEGESVSYDATYRPGSRSRVATLAIGYADGYARAFGNRGTTLVNGFVAPVLGTVTMDMTMIDVTNIPCEIGDVATLIGRDGTAVITVEDAARAASISPYELLTGLPRRMEYVYLGERA